MINALVVTEKAGQGDDWVELIKWRDDDGVASWQWPDKGNQRTNTMEKRRPSLASENTLAESIKVDCQSPCSVLHNAWPVAALE